MRQSLPLLDNRQRMRFAQGAQYVRALVAIIALVTFIVLYQALRDIQEGRSIVPGTGQALTQWGTVVEYGEYGSFLLGLVSLALWMYRAYHNVHQLPFARPRYDTSMAAWSWIIPIMNLWAPYRIMQDIGRYTVRKTDSPQRATPARFHNAAAIWWTFHLGLLVASRVNAAFARNNDPTIEQLVRNCRLMMATEVFILFSVLAALAMLQAIAPHEQDLLAAAGIPATPEAGSTGSASTPLPATE